MRNEKPKESDAVSGGKHTHGNSVASLQYARINILQCINKTHPFASCPSAKHQNIASLGLQTYEKNQWTFLWYRTGSCNNFVNLGSFAKISVPAESIISCFNTDRRCPLWFYWFITQSAYLAMGIFRVSYFCFTCNIVWYRQLIYLLTGVCTCWWGRGDKAQRTERDGCGKETLWLY